MSEQTMEAKRADVYDAGTRWVLWFGLLGGAVAWLAHLLLAYLIAEFGCLSRFRDVMFLGITGIAWAIIAASIATTLLAAAAALVAFKSERALRAQNGDAPEQGENLASGIYVARAGRITSALFVFIILVESLPIFFYLRDC